MSSQKSTHAQAGAAEFAALVLVFAVVYDITKNAVIAGLASTGCWLATILLYNAIAYWMGWRTINKTRALDVFYWWP